MRTFSDEEIRSLFECMVSGCVANGENFAKAMAQSRSMCKAKIPACQVNEKQFGGEDNVLTFTYTKTTKMIQIQGVAFVRAWTVALFPVSLRTSVLKEAQLPMPP